MFVQEWFDEMDAEELEWTAQAPDLNPHQTHLARNGMPSASSAEWPNISS